MSTLPGGVGRCWIVGLAPLPLQQLLRGIPAHADDHGEDPTLALDLEAVRPAHDLVPLLRRRLLDPVRPVGVDLQAAVRRQGHAALGSAGPGQGDPGLAGEGREHRPAGVAPHAHPPVPLEIAGQLAGRHLAHRAVAARDDRLAALELQGQAAGFGDDDARRRP